MKKTKITVESIDYRDCVDFNFISLYAFRIDILKKDE